MRFEAAGGYDLEARLAGILAGLDLAVLIATHDRAFLDAVIERILALDPISQSLRDIG